MRKLKYYVASALDGFIAREDGTWDGFLMDGPHVVDYLESFQEFDAVLMGRKTYEIGVRAGKTNPYPMMKSYVFSRTMKESLDAQVRLVSENASEFVRELKCEPGKAVYLCGGANLATALFQSGLIDEIIVKLNPVLFGTGVSLFAERVRRADLELIESKLYANGVALLRYVVK